MGRRGSFAAVVAALLLAAGCGGGAQAGTRQAVIKTVPPAEAAALVAGAPEGLVVLDIRTPEEFAAGRLAGAVNLDFYAPTFAADLAALDRGVPYLLYCRTDNRSEAAREMMRGLGFVEVHEIAGGIVAWAQAGLPVEIP